MADSRTSPSSSGRGSILTGGVYALQVLKPMWPFIVAGGVTFYLVSKAQDAAVKCESRLALPRKLLTESLQRRSTRTTPGTLTGSK